MQSVKYIILLILLSSCRNEAVESIDKFTIIEATSLSRYTYEHNDMLKGIFLSDEFRFTYGSEEFQFSIKEDGAVYNKKEMKQTQILSDSIEIRNRLLNWHYKDKKRNFYVLDRSKKFPMLYEVNHLNKALIKEGEFFILDFNNEPIKQFDFNWESSDTFQIKGSGIVPSYKTAIRAIDTILCKRVYEVIYSQGSESDIYRYLLGIGKISQRDSYDLKSLLKINHSPLEDVIEESCNTQK